MMLESNDVIWELHMKFIDLCMSDEITHKEHNDFEDILDAMYERRSKS